jgi:hypothetical protein
LSGIVGDRTTPSPSAKPTNGWGPFEVNKQPGTYLSIANPQNGVSIACPCIIAYDPFNKHINGGVDFQEGKLLAKGVTDRTFCRPTTSSERLLASRLKAPSCQRCGGRNFDETTSEETQISGNHHQDWPADHFVEDLGRLVAPPPPSSVLGHDDVVGRQCFARLLHHPQDAVILLSLKR